MTTQSLPFTQGGQTQLHKLRMLRQVSASTFRIAFWACVVTWCIYYSNSRRPQLARKTQAFDNYFSQSILKIV